jgi:hypothetical protein
MAEHASGINNASTSSIGVTSPFDAQVTISRHQEIFTHLFLLIDSVLKLSE